MPYAASARSAPLTRPSITWQCQLAATTATFRSLASKGCEVVPGAAQGVFSLLLGVLGLVVDRNRGRSTGGRWCPIRLRLRAEVGLVVLRRADRERDALGHADAEVLQVAVLSGLLVISRTDSMPRSRRTWVAVP